MASARSILVGIVDVGLKRRSVLFGVASRQDSFGLSCRCIEPRQVPGRWRVTQGAQPSCPASSKHCGVRQDLSHYVPSKCKQRTFSSKWPRFGPLPLPTALSALVPLERRDAAGATAAPDLRRRQPSGQVVGSRSCSLLLLLHALRSRHRTASSGTSACAPPWPEASGCGSV